MSITWYSDATYTTEVGYSGCTTWGHTSPYYIRSWDQCG
jgi:hypothetical protein